MIGSFGDGSPRCSRAGCDEDAVWAVCWRNPRIHGPERVKVWLACDDHRQYLAGFLESRGFPVAVTPAGAPVERLPDAEGMSPGGPQ
ncbi:hypothetical protein [Galbitalea soli]|uniref:Acetone carboxylase n=1 Tax=Galbitalea soli TaxID=1268042 RepID=A0A7C9PLD9_9MICO|nr:hypothetical protein [Galbitalea soli]NEM90145.1 hypothetical protein [Galbitalea soli]NYJ30853.1 hypothetical protein [Galbitalea soli]